VKVVVDTCVWSIALRRGAAVSAPELAAEYYSALRAKGIQGSNTEFLICAAAVRRGFAVLTTDQDFTRYRGVVPLRLHRPRREP